MACHDTELDRDRLLKSSWLGVNQARLRFYDVPSECTRPLWSRLVRSGPDTAHTSGVWSPDTAHTSRPTRTGKADTDVQAGDN